MVFKQQNKRKWIATIVVSIFFIFFWVNGPFQNNFEEFFLLEQNDSTVKPKLISDSPKKNHYLSKEIGEFETDGEGFSLITDDSEKIKQNSELISFEENIVTNSDYGNKLRNNAIKFYSNKKAKFTLRQTESFFYIEIEDNKNRLFYFQSKGISDQIKGYSGPINIGVFTTESGHLSSLHLVSSIETKSYLQKIARTNYYSQYNHQNLTKTHHVDAVSGATITTKAIALTATDLIQKVSVTPMENLTDKIGISNYETHATLSFYWIFEIIIIFILFMYAFQKKLRKSKRFVTLTSVASTLFIGFFLNESFTYVTFIHPFIGTTLSSFMGLYALFVLLGAIWGKNTYCKHICPYGNIQRLQLKLTKGLNKKFFLKNQQIKQVRFSILFFLIVGILAGIRNLSHLEPFPYIFGVEIHNVWYFTFAIFALIMNWVYPMIWCRLLCPTGSILDTITLLSNKNNKHARKT